MTTDSSIIRRSLSDPPAFAELFERHASAIGRFAAQRVGSDGGQDVLSETFLIAFRKRDRFDHAWESARPWLFGIATRVIRRMTARDARQWRAIAASAAVAEAGHADGASRSDDRIDAGSTMRGLADRIAALPSGDRDVLLLHAWGDLTYEQIGVALGIPVGTVRSRLNRVRRRLRVPELTTTLGEEGNHGRAVEQGA